MTESATRGRVVAVAWVVAIVGLTFVLPAGGLAAAVVAVLTTYRRSARGVKVLLLVAGGLTVALQVSPAIVIHRHLETSIAKVQGQ